KRTRDLEHRRHHACLRAGRLSPRHRADCRLCRRRTRPDAVWAGPIWWAVDPVTVRIFGGDGPPVAKAPSNLVPETKPFPVCVIIAWLIGWTILGAWRMTTRDA